LSTLRFSENRTFFYIGIIENEAGLADDDLKALIFKDVSGPCGFLPGQGHCPEALGREASFPPGH
jgi:hypothetical protein